MTSEQELKEEYEKKLQDLKIEQDLEKLVMTETGLKPESIHLHPLYGNEGSISFGNTYVSGDKSSLAEALVLAKAFPPASLLLRKSDCKSFVTEAWWDEQKGEEGKVEAVAPFLLKLDFACVPQHGHAPIAELSWSSSLEGRVMEIEVRLPPWEICRWSFSGTSQTNAYRSITDTIVGFVPGWGSGNAVPVLYHQDGEKTSMECIRWGRGSNDSGHKFTYYSPRYDADLVSHLEQLIAHTTR